MTEDFVAIVCIGVAAIGALWIGTVIAILVGD